jgi:hypothetical protein
MGYQHLHVCRGSTSYLEFLSHLEPLVEKEAVFYAIGSVFLEISLITSRNWDYGKGTLI